MQNSIEKNSVDSIIAAAEYDSEREDQSPIETSPTWVQHCNSQNYVWKETLGGYVVSHMVNYGEGLMLGSGTTLTALADKLILFQTQNGIAYDLKVASINLDVIRRFRGARTQKPGLFGNTQINLIGGEMLVAMDSLCGQYAVHAINSEIFYPDKVFLGVEAISFSGGKMRIGYQFQEELTVQRAFGSRSTTHRIILADHSKFKIGGWTSDIDVKTLMSNTKECSIISTLPDDPEGRALMEEHISGFRNLLQQLVAAEEQSGAAMEGDLKLVLINKDGCVVKEQSLQALRQAKLRILTKESAKATAARRERNGMGINA